MSLYAVFFYDAIGSAHFVDLITPDTDTIQEWVGSRYPGFTELLIAFVSLADFPVVLNHERVDDVDAPRFVEVNCRV